LGLEILFQIFFILFFWGENFDEIAIAQKTINPFSSTQKKKTEKKEKPLLVFILVFGGCLINFLNYCLICLKSLNIIFYGVFLALLLFIIP
jgi:hypothetical protein